jgi:hypothetical protein
VVVQIVCTPSESTSKATLIKPFSPLGPAELSFKGAAASMPVSAYSQRATPPWPEQAPVRPLDVVYVPSLHWPVAPAGGMAVTPFFRQFDEKALYVVFALSALDIAFQAVTQFFIVSA